MKKGKQVKPEPINWLLGCLGFITMVVFCVGLSLYASWLFGWW
jgi:hypothetical protein